MVEPRQRRKDGEADSNEEVGSVGVRLKEPGSMDARLGGAARVILVIESPACFRSTAVWGDPRVS